MRWILLTAVLSLLLAACGGRPGALEPPEIYYGQDVCAHCGMIISDPRFASVIVSPEGESRKYDDLGCMLDDYSHDQAEMAAIYVHDYNTSAWLDGKAAFYVRANDLHTPMASGLVAFGDRAAAEALAEAHGAETLTFEQAAAQQAEMPSHQHDH
jgi:copper chaperone NosL